MITRGIFVTGTDTGVGKTYLTCLLASHFQQSGHSVGLYKPACSGAERSESGDWVWDDLERLAAVLPDGVNREWICPQKWKAPLAPPVAAEREGMQVDRDLLRTGAARWLGRVEFLLVEGVGGWRSPIADGETVAELARDLGFPVLIVAANRLGMINQTLLTLESIRNLSLPVSGIVVNSLYGEDDESIGTNADVLRRMTSVPVWGPLPQETGAESNARDQIVRQVAFGLQHAQSEEISAGDIR